MAQSVQAEDRSIFLMTAVVEVRGKKRARVRVFLDPGAQVSFVTSALVTAIGALQMGTSRISIKGFGSPSQVTEAPTRSLVLISQDGSANEIIALEQRRLDLAIPQVPKEVEERWKIRGVQVSDSAKTEIPSDVHVLIGADYVNHFLLEKKVVEGEVA